MAVSFEINMQPRKQLGTAASRRLRRLEEKVPAILYIKNQPNVVLSIEHSSLSQLLQNEAFYSNILTLKVGQDTYPAILKGIQRDPVKPKILHLDFQGISESTKISVQVPLHFEGAGMAPGVKQGGGTVSYQLTNIELRCLPKDLPEFITVDISKLGINEPITLFQLALPEGVTLTQRTDRVVVTILAPRGASSKTTTDSES